MMPIMLAPNFSMRGFVRSDIAAANGIDNSLPLSLLGNAMYLHNAVLQPIRDYTGRPLYQSSGYRCKALNILVGGDAASYHLKALASDVVDYELSPVELAHLIRDKLPYLPVRKVIVEYGERSDWVHIDCELPRRKFLTAQRNSKGKMVYTEGIQ